MGPADNHFFRSHDVGTFIYLLPARLMAMPASNVAKIDEQRIGKHLEGTAVAPSNVRTGGLFPQLRTADLLHTARWKEPGAPRGVWLKQYLRELRFYNL